MVRANPVLMPLWIWVNNCSKDYAVHGSKANVIMSVNYMVWWLVNDVQRGCGCNCASTTLVKYL